MPDTLIGEVKKVANDKKKPATATLLFRMLICTIFDDDQIWLYSTSKEMLKTHDAEVRAAYSKQIHLYF